MQCPYCAYNSAATNAPGPFLVKHFKDEHGMDFDTAVTELRRIKAGQPSEVAALRARVAELENQLRMAESVIKTASKVLAVQRSNPEMHDRLCALSSAIADYREARWGDSICSECGTRHAPHTNTLCSS